MGSRTIKIVTLDSRTGELLSFKQAETTYSPLEQSRRLLDAVERERLVATGYGRKLVLEHFGGQAITEIQAHALGAARLFPGAGAVLDIGGQDTKAISFDTQGKIRKFEMNDRCAAGTGKFLEFMATSFQVPVDRFGTFALAGKPGITINSMCTVFAETEATSLMARGQRPQDIALALHLSVVKRSISMLKRICTPEPVVFSGGVARNPCMVDLVRREARAEIFVPENPELVGALGAALYGVGLN